MTDESVEAEYIHMEYHFAPDFLNLLVETIPRLNRSKRDVLLFFRGAGVQSRHTADLEADIQKSRDSHTGSIWRARCSCG